MKIGITGASGLIGTALGRLAVAHGHEVIAFTRDPARARLEWASQVRPADMGAAMPLDASGLDALVNLAGESILGRWTEAKKKRIRESRVEFTQKLTRCIAAASPRPMVFLSGSAVGFYGDRGDETLLETAAPGDGFLAQVCVDWEAAALRAEQLGVRVVLLRTGVVLGAEGGAFKLMRKAFAACLGGRLGSGRQWMPWVHLQDEARMILWAAEQPAVSGPLNVVAPGGVTNEEFTRALARVLHRPAFMHVPAFALKCLLGEAAAMVLDGQHVIPGKAMDHGFQFDHPELEEALEALVAAA
ncbi:MAG: hypothetical protein JWO94_757 [Verrucomicrobiaceae bacterium]|nr:hypothetical protein [Verrucomicrobiaceae bacterium]